MSTALLVFAFAWAWSAPGYWLFTITAAVIMAISTIGLLVVVGWSNEVSLAQAGLTGTAVYLCAWADRTTSGLGWPFLGAVGFVVAVVVVISALIALGTARLSGIYILVVTLALQTMIELAVFTQASVVGSGSRYVSTRPSLFGHTLNGDKGYLLFALGALAVVAVTVVRLRRTRFGRGLLLVGTDRQVAAAVGVSPWSARVLAFAFAGLCAAVAGALTAPLYTTPPGSSGYTAFSSLLYVAVPVLAGFHSVTVVAAVAAGLVILPEALESYRISPFLLGGVSILVGSLVGRNGISGLILGRVRPDPRAAGKGDNAPREVSLLASADTTPERTRLHATAIAVLEDYLPSRIGAGEVLSVENVSVRFGGVQALQDASLSLSAGQMVGLIGPNGAGKTTLFNVVSGFCAPDQGRILFDGADITDTRPWERARRGVSRTFQASRLDLDLSVAENLLAGASPMVAGNLIEAVLGLPKARSSARRAETAAWAVAVLLDIEHYWSEPAGSLSFGNRRRVEIGRAIMSGPHVLLLDEPSAGLDPVASRLLFSLIKRLQWDLGITLLLVEHHVRDVLDNCDVVYAMSRGTVIAAGTPDEVARHPEVVTQYLGPAQRLRGARAPT